MKYSIEISKIDRRRKTGKTLLDTVEVDVPEREDAEAIAERLVKGEAKKTAEVFKTYRTVRHALSGEPVEEHYKTPWSCSVASEAYFCA